MILPCSRKRKISEKIVLLSLNILYLLVTYNIGCELNGHSVLLNSYFPFPIFSQRQKQSSSKVKFPKPQSTEPGWQGEMESAPNPRVLQAGKFPGEGRLRELGLINLQRKRLREAFPRGINSDWEGRGGQGKTPHWSPGTAQAMATNRNTGKSP